MIHVEARKETKAYEIKWNGIIMDLLAEIAVLLYAIHQESGIDREKLFRELEALFLATYEVTPQEEGE